MENNYNNQYNYEDINNHNNHNNNMILQWSSDNLNPVDNSSIIQNNYCNNNNNNNNNNSNNNNNGNNNVNTNTNNNNNNNNNPPIQFSNMNGNNGVFFTIGGNQFSFNQFHALQQEYNNYCYRQGNNNLNLSINPNHNNHNNNNNTNNNTNNNNNNNCMEPNSPVPNSPLLPTSSIGYPIVPDNNNNNSNLTSSPSPVRNNNNSNNNNNNNNNSNNTNNNNNNNNFNNYNCYDQSLQFNGYNMGFNQYSEPSTPTNDYSPVVQMVHSSSIIPLPSQSQQPQQQIIQPKIIQQSSPPQQQQQILQQKQYNNSYNMGIPSPQTPQTPQPPQPKAEIVDVFNQPFPIYTVKTHVLVPAPVIKVNGYKGDANELLVIANPEPDDSIVISQPATTCSDGTFEFRFSDMHVDRKKHDPCSSFRLRFSVINRKTFLPFDEVLSPPINLYYHTDLLPAPDIARLVPNSCFCGQEPEVTCYGYYFKKGRTEILYVDLEPIEPSPDHQSYSVKQEQLRMPNQTSFSFAFVPPSRSTAGSYNVSTRYTKSTQKKEKDGKAGSKNKSKVGKPHPFTYNELPENGNPKRQRSTPIDYSGNPSSPSSDEYQYNGNAGYGNGNMMGYPNNMGGGGGGNMNGGPNSPNYFHHLNCVIHGEVEELEDLIGSNKELVNAVRDSQGNTLVMIAAREGRLDMVEYLMENDCDLTLRNKSNHTVFHMACYSGSIEVVEKVLEVDDDMLLDVNVLAQDSVGATGLHIATERGHYRLVKYLLANYEVLAEAKDHHGLTALHYAVQDNNVRIVTVLIDHFLFCGENKLNQKDYTGMTPLHWAAALGRYNIVVKLIEAGADINAVDGDNESPIFKSIATHNKDITIYLIEKNIDASILNSHKKDYIEWLALHNSDQVDSEEEDEKDEKVTNENVITPVAPSTPTPAATTTTSKIDIVQQFSKLSTTEKNDVIGQGGSTTTTTTTTTSSSTTKRSIIDQCNKFDFINPSAELDLSNMNPHDITVNRIETLIQEVERNSDNKENYKNKELTTMLQDSFNDKVVGWMNSEEELLQACKKKSELEDELSCKVQEIMKLNDFISACPVELTNIKAGSLGLFILKRERYYGFHQSDTLVISSNDSMNAIKKIYGNSLPSVILCNVVFSMKTQSTKPSALMPIIGTEFYVVDLEVHKPFDPNF